METLGGELSVHEGKVTMSEESLNNLTPILSKESLESSTKETLFEPWFLMSIV
jgi:hypothetical protein